MEIQSFNDKDFTYFNNALCEIEAEEERLNRSKSTNPKYLKKRRKELIVKYQGLLMKCLASGYTHSPSGRGIVSTLVNDMENAVERNTLRLKA